MNATLASWRDFMIPSFLRCEFGALVSCGVFPSPPLCSFSVKSKLAKSGLFGVSRNVLSTRVPSDSKGSDNFIQLKETCFWLGFANSSLNLKMLESSWIFFYHGHFSSWACGGRGCVEGDDQESDNLTCIHHGWRRLRDFEVPKGLLARCLS